MNRGKYAHLGLWVKFALGTSSYVSKIPPVLPKKQRITVSVFLSTLQLTAWLLKSFRLRLHHYTLLTRAESYLIDGVTHSGDRCPSMTGGDALLSRIWRHARRLTSLHLEENSRLCTPSNWAPCILRSNHLSHYQEKSSPSCRSLSELSRASSHFLLSRRCNNLRDSDLWSLINLLAIN